MSNNIENSPLAGKVALITGAGQGIGQGMLSLWQNAASKSSLSEEP